MLLTIERKKLNKYKCIHCGHTYRALKKRKCDKCNNETAAIGEIK